METLAGAPQPYNIIGEYMSQELVPYSDIEKMGKAVAGSGLFGVKTEQQAIALMLIAQAYGQHPAIAAMEYHIIAGKPSKKSEAMLASFIQAGGKVLWHKLDDTIADATFSHPSGGELRLTWDIKMAEKAGLLAKEGTLYKKYPRAMLRSRLIAEGVRTIYPAATGGMLAKEEIEDIIEPDATKSRVETIIDAHIEEVKSEPKEVESKPEIIKKGKKTDIKEIPTGNENHTKLPEGHKTIQGIITTPATYAEIGEAKTPKWVFKMGELKLGTFDKSVFESISAVLDLQKDTPILLNIEYKERISGDKTLRDIVKFSQATKMEPPI